MNLIYLLRARYAVTGNASVGVIVDLISYSSVRCHAQ